MIQAIIPPDRRLLCCLHYIRFFAIFSSLATFCHLHQIIHYPLSHLTQTVEYYFRWQMLSKKNWKITLLISICNPILNLKSRVCHPFSRRVMYLYLNCLIECRERCEDPREYIDQSPRGLGGSSPLLGKLFVNDKEEHLPTPGPIISHHQPKGSPHEEKKNFVNSANNVHIVNIAFSLFVDIWI